MTVPRPWPEGTRPTAAQLLEWLRDPGHAADYGDALRILDQLLTADERAYRCLLMDHDGAITQAHRLTTRLIELEESANAVARQAGRYRLAWLNARHRARTLRIIALRRALMLPPEEDSR